MLKDAAWPKIMQDMSISLLNKKVVAQEPYIKVHIQELAKIPFIPGNRIYPPKLVDAGLGTESCNSDCKLCSGINTPKIENEVTVDNYEEIYKKILDYVVTEKETTYWVENIHFSHRNSDPMMDPAFPLIADYIKKRERLERLSREITVITNGIKLRNQKIREVIVEHIDVLSISINGTNEKQYRNNHRVNEFENILANIEKIKKMSAAREKPLHIDVTHVIFPESLEDMDKFLNLLDYKGVRKIFFRQNFFELDLLRLKEDKNLIHEYQEKYQKENRSLQIILKEKGDKYNNIDNLCVSGVLRPAMMNGKLYPCIHAGESTSFGNLFHNTMQEIFEAKFSNGKDSFSLECAGSCPSGNSFYNKVARVIWDEL